MADAAGGSRGKSVSRKGSKSSVAGSAGSGHTSRKSSRQNLSEIDGGGSGGKQMIVSRTDSNLSRKKSGFMLQYAAGELEAQYMQKVAEGDYDWVQDHLTKTGRDLVLSEFGGGYVHTAILYAAKNGDIEMCKLLVKWGGKELLKVKDLKSRDAAHYAAEGGWDINTVTAEASVDCWNHKALTDIQKTKEQARLRAR